MSPAPIRAVRAVTAAPPAPGAMALAPLGIASSLGSVAGFGVEGGRIIETLGELETGQQAALIATDGDGPLVFTWRYAPTPDAPRYPEAAWTPRRNRWTTAAEDLVAASRAIAKAAGGGDAGIAALVAETRARFAYDHPETRFNDGCEVVPFLGCGVAAGSCVDINTYLVASLRAAGYEAAYLYGWFFPAEKVDRCVDGHCWVATRHDGRTLDWDVAHHIKAGLDPVGPALNPRGGRRVAVSHSMGWRFALGDRELTLKLLGEPAWLLPDGAVATPDQQEIRAL
ncbi:transglutaminase-like domain-containing protein [Rubrimonas cliftonensis]|uniref:Transglutaminase-like superfamily protein n=1 Tax=Rubrimonas cliftonensis TaxID=89524 RepID=A0A1H4F1S1_9RHOB|nr:transglutaminase-like domain-containing protein [Rubrimonas cliftonensis]SEA90738.1 Transglutaminase-like superfamily protein [Rubrimonas cliftonensis]